MRRGLVAVCFACGGGFGAPSPSPLDASAEAQQPLVREAGPSGDAAVNRVSPHDGIVVTVPQVLLVYVGEAGVDTAPSQDSFVDWVLASPDYWAILQQYGVGYGTRVGSVRALRSDIVPGALVGSTGLIS